METRTPGEGVPPASKAGQRLHCAGRVGHCRRWGDQTGPEEPWVPHAPDFLLPTDKASEGHGSRSAGLSGFRKPGPRPVSGVGSARPPLGVPSPSLRASVGASQAEQHGGPRAQERKARGAGGRGAGGSGTRAQGTLPSSSARRRSSSARLGLLHYCFRPPRRRLPRAGPAPSRPCHP